MATSTIDGTWAAWRHMLPAQRTRISSCAGYSLVLTLLFIQPLSTLIAYAWHSDLHSHIVLVPLISAYLLYLQREGAIAYRSSIMGAIASGVTGLAAWGSAIKWRSNLSMNDHLALTTLAFLILIGAGGFLFFGSKWMRARAFPIAFLLFMVPLPAAVVDWLEKASMHASADTAAALLNLAGTAMVRHGTVFELPGIVIQVAQECSGIRSSWVLFISSLLASHLFLRTRWRSLMLVAFVIPLGILRNGFRILVIGLLCVHIGPEMIDSPIHHRGGPLFFALSLVPLFLLLQGLRSQERRLKVRS